MDMSESNEQTPWSLCIECVSLHGFPNQSACAKPSRCSPKPGARHDLVLANKSRSYAGRSLLGVGRPDVLVPSASERANERPPLSKPSQAGSFAVVRQSNTIAVEQRATGKPVPTGNNWLVQYGARLRSFTEVVGTCWNCGTHPELFLVGTGFPGVFDGDLCCISAWSSTRASRQACRTKAGWMKGQKRLLIGNLKLRRLRLILSSRSSIGLRALWWKKMHHSSSDCLALFVDLDLQGHCYVQSRMYRFYHVFLGQTVRQRSNPDPSGLIHWDGVRGQSILVD